MATSSRPFEVHVVYTAIKHFRVVEWAKAESIRMKWLIEHTEPEDRVRIEMNPDNGYYDVECFYGERIVKEIQTLPQAEKSAANLKEAISQGSLPGRRVEIYRKIHGGGKILLKTL